MSDSPTKYRWLMTKFWWDTLDDTLGMLLTMFCVGFVIGGFIAGGMIPFLLLYAAVRSTGLWP